MKQWMDTEERYACVASRSHALFAGCVCALALHHREIRILVFAPAEFIMYRLFANDRCAGFCAATYAFGLALHAGVEATSGAGVAALFLEQALMNRSPLGAALVALVLLPAWWLSLSWLSVLAFGILVPLALKRWSLALIRVPLCVVLAGLSMASAPTTLAT